MASFLEAVLGLLFLYWVFKRFKTPGNFITLSDAERQSEQMGQLLTYCKTLRAIATIEEPSADWVFLRQDYERLVRKLTEDLRTQGVADSVIEKLINP